MTLADQARHFAATDVGRKRSCNEDNFLADPTLGLFVVADGMGGHAAGEVASAIAVNTIREVLTAEYADSLDGTGDGPRSDGSSRQLLRVMEYAVKTASQRIHAEAQRDPKKRGMGTTVSALLVDGAHGYVAHVGDSRIYLLRSESVKQVTEDHTVANELLRLGMVSPDQVHNVPRRNAITRAVGVYQHADVDTLTLEILPNDQFLLASDGLTGYLDDQNKTLVEALSESNGDEAIASLIEFANEQGGKDNITAVLVRLGDGDQSDSQRARRVRLKTETLAAMPLFSGLNERELLRLIQATDVQHYDEGQLVVQEGDDGDKMFVTLEGKLQVRTGTAVLDEYGPGDHFGEMALIRSSQRSASVQALEASEVISINRADFFEIIRAEPHVAVKLMWPFLDVLANRLEQTSTQLSQAQEQLGQPSSTRAVRGVEPELDPFQAMPMQLGSRAVPLALRYGPSVDSVGKRPPGGPSFEDAPAMAERIARPSPHPPAIGGANATSRRPIPKSADDADSLKKTVQMASRVEDSNPQSATLDPTGPSAKGEPSGEDARLSDQTGTTVPDGALRAMRERGPSPSDAPQAAGTDHSGDDKHAARKVAKKFRPSKETMPLDPPDNVKSELAALRKEFKDRVADIRKVRGRDSD